ncbi:MAG: CotH kinase family protein [Bacteroidales bacterium]
MKFFLFAAFLLVFSGLTGTQSLVAQVRINEVMSQNTQTILDEDGEGSDWLELYNFSDSVVHLSGYGLTDKPSEPFQWIFPDVSLDPGQFIYLFASDKDRKSALLSWETIITAGDTFRYLVPTGTVNNWTISGFDDLSWTPGKSSFGYDNNGESNDTTKVPSGTITVYCRKSFTVADASVVRRMVLHMDYDDGFIAYLNGHELTRVNLGSPGSVTPWNGTATGHEAEMWQGRAPDIYNLDSLVKYLLTGENIFAFEIHNAGSTSSDLSGLPFLTLGYSTLQENPRGTPSFFTLPAANLHTNFKLSSSGDTLILTSPQGTLVDSIIFGSLPRDISYGLQPDGTDSKYYFAEPTPGKHNNTKGYLVTSFASPVFSQAGGFFTGPVTVSLSGAGEQDTIWYTTDGSDPGPGSSVYTTELQLDATTVIRAAITGPEKIPGRYFTNTYIIRDPKPILTTVSLATNPPNFFDWNTGIYVDGPNWAGPDPHSGANFWQDWEKPIHFELFEKNGTHVFEADAGVKIAGAWSRMNPQKSLAFFARNEYGYSSFKYPFFSNLPYKEYQNILLRNSGNDFNNTMFRDAMMHSLLDGTAVDRMAYRPVSVYINGAYWGVMEMREKINEHYLAAHHGVDPLQLDLLETSGNAIVGDANNYNALLSFLNDHLLSTKANYDSVKNWVDMNNYIDYQLSQIYFNNTDWPGNNIKYWRPRVPNGKWRWILYDTDFGFGFIGGYSNNTLSFALEENGPGWPNPPWSTFLFRKMVENPEFKKNFINRFADMMNSNFTYQNILGRIDWMQGEIKSEMGFHMERWNGSYQNWLSNVNNMRSFGRNRNKYMTAFIKAQFSLTGYDTLTLESSVVRGGVIQLNSLRLSSFPWRGVYFYGVSVPITARPNPGYRFVRWEGPVTNPNAMSTFVNLTKKDLLRAVFEKDETNLSDVVINEINYNSPPDFDPEDWVELFNKGDYTIDISNWILKDADNLHRFVIPNGTYIYPKEYLVLSRERNKYTNAFPTKGIPTGDFVFGLGSGADCVRLYSGDSILVDSVMYSSVLPWPVEANGTGASLELISPEYDNSLPASWKSSPSPHGTPGEKNGSYEEVHVIAEGGPEAAQLLLEQNFPNPFSLTTSIYFSVVQKCHVNLTVYDLQGRTVSILFSGQMEPGRQQIFWDGTDSGGQQLPDGMYLLKLDAGGQRASRLMTIQH